MLRNLNNIRKLYQLFGLVTNPPKAPFDTTRPNLVQPRRDTPYLPLDTTKVNLMMLGDHGELYKKYDSWWETLSYGEQMTTLNLPQNSIEAKALQAEYIQEKLAYEVKYIEEGPLYWQKQEAYQYIQDKIQKIGELIKDPNFY